MTIKDVLPAETPDSSGLVTEGQAQSTCAAGKGGPLSALDVLEVSNTTALYEKSLRLKTSSK